MFSILKSSVVGLVLSAGLLAGCQTGGGMASHEMMTSAVQCDKCQMTWVKMPTDNGKGRIVGYTSSKKMECPDCKDAVQNFLVSGKLKPTCTTCGGNMTVCDMH